MSGADIVASVALGARFTMIGRAYLYGLMAGGREGVDRTIEILSEQIARTMRLLGVNSLEELNPGHVLQLERLVPRAVAPSMVAAAEPAASRARKTAPAAATAVLGTPTTKRAPRAAPAAKAPTASA